MNHTIRKYLLVTALVFAAILFLPLTIRKSTLESTPPASFQKNSFLI